MMAGRKEKKNDIVRIRVFPQKYWQDVISFDSESITENFHEGNRLIHHYNHTISNSVIISRDVKVA